VLQGFSLNLVISDCFGILRNTSCDSGDQWIWTYKKCYSGLFFRISVSLSFSEVLDGVLLSETQ